MEQCHEMVDPFLFKKVSIPGHLMNFIFFAKIFAKIFAKFGFGVGFP